MTDCAHWLEPMLESVERELAEEKRLRRKDRHVAQNAINEIRAIINNADVHFSCSPFEQQFIKSLDLQREQNYYRQLLQRQQPEHGGLFNGLFGGGWPF